MVFLGNPEYGVNMAPLDFVKFAEAAGARGMHIEDLRTCAGQLREAMLAQALRQGTPNRNHIALQLVKDMLDEAWLRREPRPRDPGQAGRSRLRDRRQAP